MSSRRSFIARLLIPILCVGCQRATGNPAEAAAIAAIQQLGGKVEVDEKNPDKPAIKVYLHRTRVKDSDLAHLAQLKQLQNLFLGRTQITDAGLVHLRQAIHLKTLSLNATGVTDAGLQHLIELKNLKTLNLQETKVTATGAAKLKAQIPAVTIAR